MAPTPEPGRSRTPASARLRGVEFVVELDREVDGRWIAEVPDLPGVMAYGATRDAALASVQALALRVLADRLEHGETAPGALSVSFTAA